MGGRSQLAAGRSRSRSTRTPHPARSPLISSKLLAQGEGSDVRVGAAPKKRAEGANQSPSRASQLGRSVGNSRRHCCASPKKSSYWDRGVAVVANPGRRPAENRTLLSMGTEDQKEPFPGTLPRTPDRPRWGCVRDDGTQCAAVPTSAAIADECPARTGMHWILNGDKSFMPPTRRRADWILALGHRRRVAWGGKRHRARSSSSATQPGLGDFRDREEDGPEGL